MASPDLADLSAATLHLYRISGVVGLLLLKSGNQLANHMPFADVRTSELGEHVTQMAAGYSQVKRRVRQVLMLFDSGSLLIMMKDQIQLALLLTPQADLDKASLAAGAFLADYAAQLDTAATPVVEKEKEMEKPPEPALAPAPLRVVTQAVPLVSQAVPVVSQAVPVVSHSEPVVRMAIPLEEQPAIKEKALVVVEQNVWPKVRAILETILGKVMGHAQAIRLIDRMSEAKHGNGTDSITPVEAKALARDVLDQVPNRGKRDALLSELEHALTESKL